VAPEDLGNADIPSRVMEWALPELAEVSARLDALAEAACALTLFHTGRAATLSQRHAEALLQERRE
jgi:hypothetical protein